MSAAIPARFLLPPSERKGGCKYRWELLDAEIADLLDEGLGHREIAQCLHIPYCTLKSRIGYATTRANQSRRSAEDERRAEWIRGLPPHHPVSRALAEMRGHA